MTGAGGHIPVMLEETLEALQPAPGKTFIDCTVGAAGHAYEIGRRLVPGGSLIVIDRDEKALDMARTRLDSLEIPVRYMRGSFSEAIESLTEEGVEADGALLDLGMSSMQIDDPTRGFSYMKDGPLDMRMDTTRGPTAADVVNSYEKERLARIFKNLGEEKWSTRIARDIVAERGKRPFSSTAELVEVIDRAVPFKERRGHSSKRVFQALRIEVNAELDELSSALEKILALLKRGARIVIISFHSLEDRMVKETFRRLSSCSCPRNLPVCACEPKLRLVYGKAVKPSEGESRSNPRAASAVLRAAEVA